jgi:UPF0716 protein FxsA
MLGRLLLFFIITPLIEMALLVKLGEAIGFWPTLGIVLVTGILGSYLTRREGLSVWRRFNERLKEGGLPGDELADGVMILLAGALLITPGVLTDFVGLAGLLPFTRVPLRRALMKRLKKHYKNGSFGLRVHTFGGQPGPAPQEPVDEEPNWEGQARDLPHHARS